ncbi:MFS transporter [Kribbella sp. NPDC056861]|uniref:MFS transporter n=1 Tax=Kribbella sp. NPDC056861 TaxID=3154857 RepID=UPI003438E4EA
MSDSLLKNGDYLRLMTGQSISSLGTAMSSFVFTLLAMSITGSPIQAGLVGTAGALGGTLASLPAGALVDRLNRRKVLIACGAAGTILLGSVSVAGWLDRLTIGHLIVVSFAGGVGYAFFQPAQTAALRQIVAPEQLGTAMAANEGREHAAGLLGAPLGGILYSISRLLPIAVDAISYLVMTVLLATIRQPLPAPKPDGDKHEPILRAIRAGLSWLVRQPALRVITLSATLLNFAAGGTLLVLVLNLQQLGVHASAIGLLNTGLGVGGLLGSFAAPRLLRRFRTGAIAIVASWAIAIAFSLTAFSTRTVVLVALLGAAFLLVPAVNAGLFGYLVMITPDGMQGRAQSALMFLATAVGPLAPALGGVLLATAGARTALLVFGGALGLVALMLTLSRSVRTIPLLSDVAAEQTV